MANPKQNDAPAGALSKPPELPESAPPAPSGPSAATFTRAPELTEAPPAPPPSALIITNADGMLCRPPVGVALHTLGPVVIGNWFGHVDGKTVTVEHGTPVRGLPGPVLQRIRETPDQKIGPFDSRKKTAQQRAPGT